MDSNIIKKLNFILRDYKVNNEDYNELIDLFKNYKIKKLKLYNLKKQKKLLIAFGKKVQDNIFKSDKFRTVEDSYEEFKRNL